MMNRSDSSNFLQIRAGKTADQDMGFEFYGHDAKPRFSIYRTAGGAVFFRDCTNKGIVPLSFTSGADTAITASGSTSPLNLQQNSTGDLMFYSNAPTNTRMKSAGNFVFGDRTKAAITVETGGNMAFYTRPVPMNWASASRAVPRPSRVQRSRRSIRKQASGSRSA
jgi:hypothetical protein